ncbi:hypothetical protein V8C44DRAFT_330863 [Trichoderma aethiopicum]
MAMGTEDVAAILALLLEVLGWLLHIFFATGYIILCKWLEHIRNHEFDQRPRKIDRRYCLMAVIFYAFAAASHLIYALKVAYHAMASYRREKNQPELRGEPRSVAFYLVIVISTYAVPHIVLLFPYIRWLRRFEADDEGRNLSYTIACIAVSAINISVAAFWLLRGPVLIICLAIWPRMKSGRGTF